MFKRIRAFFTKPIITELNRIENSLNFKLMDLENMYRKFNTFVDFVENKLKSIERNLEDLKKKK